MFVLASLRHCWRACGWLSRLYGRIDDRLRFVLANHLCWEEHLDRGQTRPRQEPVPTTSASTALPVSAKSLVRELSAKLTADVISTVSSRLFSAGGYSRWR